jgi:hypothetical protein
VQRIRCRQAAGERELAASRNEVVAIDMIEITVTGRDTTGEEPTG